MLSFYLKPERSKVGGSSGLPRKRIPHWDIDTDHGSSMGMGIYSNACFFTARVRKPEDTRNQVRGMDSYLQIFRLRCS